MKVSMYNPNEKSCFTSTGIEAQAPFYQDETHLTNHKESLKEILLFNLSSFHLSNPSDYSLMT